MELKSILVGALLCFGGIIFVVSCIGLQPYSEEQKYGGVGERPKESPVIPKEFLAKLQGQYDGPLAAFAFGILVGLLQILAFIWACLKEDPGMLWNGLHIGAAVCALIGCAIGISYEIYKYRGYRGYTKEDLARSPYRPDDPVGMAFVVINGLDIVLCIIGIIVVWMKKS